MDNDLTIDAPLEDYYQLMSHRQALLCDVCDRPGKWLCKRCRSIRYCSRKCQLVASRCHNGLCMNFSIVQLLSGGPEESRNSRLVALITLGGVNLHYVEFVTLDLPYYNRCAVPSMETIWNYKCLGADHPVPEFRSSMHVGRSCMSDDGKTEWKRPLGRRLVFMQRNLLYLKGQWSNTLLDNEYVNSETQHGFGPALLYVTSPDGEFALDITAGDIHHFKENLRDNHFATSDLDYFLEKHMEQEQAEELGRSVKMVEAIRINCKGDQEINHRPHLEEMLIPDNLITDKPVDMRAPIPQAINIPLMTVAIKRDRNYSCTHYSKPLDPSLWHNGTALQLLQECDTKKERWMSRLYKSIMESNELSILNSIIFVRADRGPLCPDLVEGIINYTLDNVRPTFEEIMAMKPGREKELRRRKFLPSINEKNFERYYAPWLEQPREKRRHPDTYPWLRGTSKSGYLPRCIEFETEGVIDDTD